MNICKHNINTLTNISVNDNLILSSSNDMKIKKDDRYFKDFRHVHDLKTILTIIHTTFYHYFNIILLNYDFNIDSSNIIRLLDNAIIGLHNFYIYYSKINDNQDNDYCKSIEASIDNIISSFDTLKNITNNNTSTIYDNMICDVPSSSSESTPNVSRDISENESEHESESDHESEHESEYESDNNDSDTSSTTEDSNKSITNIFTTISNTFYNIISSIYFYIGDFFSNIF